MPKRCCVGRQIAWSPLALAGQGQGTGGDDAVQMHVILQLLIPGMQHRREARQAAQPVPGIGGQPQQGRRDAAEELAIKQPRIGRRQRIELVRQREDVVEVTHRQQLILASLEPLGGGQLLALGAVPIAARVINRPPQTAMAAFLDVPAQLGGAASFHTAHHLELAARQCMVAAEVGAVKPEDVGHLVTRPRLRGVIRGRRRVANIFVVDDRTPVADNDAHNAHLVAGFVWTTPSSTRSRCLQAAHLLCTHSAAKRALFPQ